MIFREVEDPDLIARTKRGKVEVYNLLVSRWEKRDFNYYLLHLASDRSNTDRLANTQRAPRSTPRPPQGRSADGVCNSGAAGPPPLPRDPPYPLRQPPLDRPHPHVRHAKTRACGPRYCGTLQHQTGRVAALLGFGE